MRQELNHRFLTEDMLSGTPRMVIMVGLPRSGKSTFVNAFVAEGARKGRPFTIISGDDIRRAMGVRFEPRIEDNVTYMMGMMAHAIMMRRQNVIIDELNMTEAERQRWIQMAALYEYEWTIAEIEPPDEELHKRICEQHNFPWKSIEAKKAKYQPVSDKSRRRYALIP